MPWALALTILFSAWTGPTWYSWDSHGEYILPGVWIGPGASPGFVAWPPGYGVVLGWYWGPRQGCDTAPQTCDPQTQRATFIEVIGHLQPVEAWAGRWVRTRWVALADHDTTLAAIVWQSFGDGRSAGHRIYSCPAQAMPAGQWVDLGCDIYVPTVEGLVRGSASYLGVGIDMTGAYQGAIQLQRLDVWTAS